MAEDTSKVMEKMQERIRGLDKEAVEVVKELNKAFVELDNKDRELRENRVRTEKVTVRSTRRPPRRGKYLPLRPVVGTFGPS